MKRAITGLLLFLTLLAGLAVGQNYVNSYGFLVDSTGAVVISTSPQAGAYLNSKGLLVASDGSLVVTGISGSSGTVTDVTTGNLAPLFTATTGASHTTTPVLAFTLSTAAAHTFLGNNTGSTAAPAYFRPASTDLSDLASLVTTARNVSTTSPITGGGALSADRTIACSTCATTTNGGALAGTANQISLSAAGVMALASPLTTPGAVAITGALTHTGVHTFNGSGSGTLTLDPGTAATGLTNSGTFAEKGILTLNGTTSGSATIDPGTTAAALTVSPGVTTAAATIDTITLNAANPDVILTRGGAQQLKLGGANSATPAAQSITTVVARAGTDTDVAGGALSIGAGTSTGAAIPSPVTISGRIPTASGTTAQNTTPRFVTAARKALTSGSPTTLASSPSASDVPVGGIIKFTIIGSDSVGHHNCTMSGLVLYGAENANGTQKAFPTAAAAPIVNSTCDATNTIAATFNSTNVNPSILSVTPTITGFSANVFFINYSVENLGDGAAPTF